MPFSLWKALSKCQGGETRQCSIMCLKINPDPAYSLFLHLLNLITCALLEIDALKIQFSGVFYFKHSESERLTKFLLILKTLSEHSAMCGLLNTLHVAGYLVC